MSENEPLNDENIVDSEAVLLKNVNPSHEGEEGGDMAYLSNAMHFVVRQQRSLAETLRGTEEPNVYWVHDKVTGEKVFQVQEDMDCCRQQCCGSRRPFNLRIYDKFRREVMLLERPVSCDYCCGIFCCLDTVKVSVRNYKSRNFDWNVVGTVKQSWNPIFPTFNICDSNGDVQFVIRGPFITYGCFGTVDFSITPKSGIQVGSISKYWYGLCTELTSNADLFEIKFPAGEIDEKLKATMLGALFLVDFKYYE